MKLKKALVTAITIIGSALISTSVFAADDITVEVNGDKIKFVDQGAEIVDGRTLIPLRGVFDSMGFEVTWDDVSRSAKISNSLKDITVTENLKRITANTKTFDIDVAPQILNSRLMIPLRAIAESIDATVEWDSTTKTVSIYYNKADGVDNSINNIGMDEQQYFKTLISLMEELRTTAEPLEDAVLDNVANLGSYSKTLSPKINEAIYTDIESILDKILELKAPDGLEEANSYLEDYVNLIKNLINFSKTENPQNFYDRSNEAFMSQVQDYQQQLEDINSGFGNVILKYFMDNKVYWEGIYGENILDILKY